jgi:proton-dependent oligopeptide transporter, POT family
MKEEDSELTKIEIKKTTRVLFFTQIFSTLSYSIIFSTLMLYATEKLHIEAGISALLVASFIAFNYGLHFLGGYMGGKYISNRFLFIIGVSFQLLACFIIAQTTYTSLMIGLAIFLTGSGLNVTCMNGMMNQLFDNPDDPKREKAFLWNYSGMNIGFFLGFTISGYFQLKQNYSAVFIFGGLACIVAITTVLLNWDRLKDRDTYLTETPKEKHKIQLFKAIGIIIIVLAALLILLKHPLISNAIVLATAVLMIIATFFIAATRKSKKERRRMAAFIFFLIAGLMFWAIYQLSPMGMMFFIAHNVNLKLLGFQIAPQWTNNIITIVIVIGGPIMAWLLAKLRTKGYKISQPFLFAIAVSLIGLAYILLPIGIHFATPKGIVGFGWVFCCYILQSIGELCISPIGYAMIGKLIPRKLQGTMMGLWCMMSGLGGVIAGFLSKYAIGNHETTSALVTNRGFFITFGSMGILSLGFGLIMLTLVPKLYKLINEEPKKKEISTSIKRKPVTV